MGFFVYFYIINLKQLIIMVTINFPLDFELFENPCLRGRVNYVHTRIDGSCISILDSKNSEMYEIWDKKYMEHPEMMDFYELTCYLQSTVSQLITYRFLNTEDLHLN
jgi:hypothetical protein